MQTGHVGLNVTDVTRSVAFYREAFGLDLAGEGTGADRRFAFLALDGKLLLTLWEQSKAGFDTGTAGLHHLSFQVDSLDEVRAAEERLRALGAEFAYDGVVPHGEGAGSGGIFFADPDGIRLEIYAPAGLEGTPAPVAAAPTCGFF
ncbi:VOC family protein [Kitasatospora sp. NPDC101801]|uniref:VOC family protein n=1 Tax=Kitasatospora sp. NPDC101801 TaxID=3364103 RepID=UPI0037FDB5A1